MGKSRLSNTALTVPPPGLVVRFSKRLIDNSLTGTLLVLRSVNKTLWEKRTIKILHFSLGWEVAGWAGGGGGEHRWHNTHFRSRDTKSAMLGRKLHSRTCKTKQLEAVHLEEPKGVGINWAPAGNAKGLEYVFKSCYWPVYTWVMELIQR